MKDSEYLYRFERGDDAEAKEVLRVLRMLYDTK